MKYIVSSKFASKIVNVDSLEELELFTNTEEMMIPGEIRQ